MPILSVHLSDDIYQRLLSEVPPLDRESFASNALVEALERRRNLTATGKQKPGPKAPVKKETLGAYIEVDLIEWLRSQMRGPKDLGAVLSSILRQARELGLVAFPVDQKE